MQLKLLGNSEVGGNPMPLDRRGCLLSYLACSGEWLSREKIATLFWPQADQTSARRNLRRLLGRAKRLEFAGGLELTHDSARWQIDSDLMQFRRALERKDWLEALRQYSGDLLLDFTVDEVDGFGAWLELERAQLHTAYRSAALNGAELLESTGRFEEASRQLRALLDIDELAEDVLQRYMRNLYLAGKRDSALQAFDRFSALLQRDLGLEPMDQTKDVMATIRAADSLDRTRIPDGTQREQPPIPMVILRPPSLIGREREVELAMQETSPVVLIRGEAGLGKSRLLGELAPDAPILQGREGLRSLAYQPVVMLIRQCLDRDLPVPELGSYLEDLARLVPEVAPQRRPAPIDNQSPNPRLLEALARYFEGLHFGSQRERPPRFQLVFDDLQWADAASLELLAFLSHRGTLRILGALREHELSGELEDVLRGLRSARVASFIDLTPLSTGHFDRLLVQLFAGSRRPAGLTAWLHSNSGGNPLFALETLKSLFEAGALLKDSRGLRSTVEEINEAHVVGPTSVISDVITARLERLDESTNRVLQVAAVIGEGFDDDLLSRAAGFSAWAVADALAEAEASGLVDDGHFRHDLIRQSIYAGLADGRKRLLHRRVLEGLEASPRPVDSALLAHHAAGAASPEAISRHSLAAGREAGRIPAYHNAASHLRRALQHMPADDGRRGEALELLGDVLVHLWDADGARLAFEEALSGPAGASAQDYARLKRKLSLALARLSLPMEAANALAQARKRLEVSGAPVAEVELRHEWIEVILADISRQYAANEVAAMVRDVEQLRPVVEQHGSPVQQSGFYHSLGLLYSRQERYAVSKRTLEFSRKAVDTISGTGKSHLIARQRFAFGFLALWHGDEQLARSELRASLDFAEENEDLTLTMQSHTYLTVLSRLRNELDDAEAHGRSSLELASRHAKTDYHGAALANLAWLALRRGDLKGAEAGAREALSLWQSMEVPRYPFYWLACFPLIALAYQRRDWGEAAVRSAELLEPAQLKLPDELELALRRALHVHRDVGTPGPERSFDDAVKLAQRYRFL